MNLQISWKKLQIRVGPLTNSFLFFLRIANLQVKTLNQIFDFWEQSTKGFTYPSLTLQFQDFLMYSEPKNIWFQVFENFQRTSR
jgi:hypothetical protein